MKVGDLVKYSLNDELTGKEERGTAVVYAQSADPGRFLIFTNRGETIDISPKYTEVINESR